MTKNEEESKNEGEDFAKKLIKLEKVYGRDLRLDEVILLATFRSLDDIDEETFEQIMHKKKCELNEHEKEINKLCKVLEILLGRELTFEEIFMIMLNDQMENKKEVTLTACPLSEDTIKDLFKPMDECCCDKCDHKEKKMNNNESITGFKELDDALNSIPSDELDKILKAESEKKKSSSNHEFSDAIAEAALEICGIDLKTGRPKEE